MRTINSSSCFIKIPFIELQTMKICADSGLYYRNILIQFKYKTLTTQVNIYCSAVPSKQAKQKG